MTPEAQRLAEAVAWLKSGEAMMGPRTEAAVSVVLDQLASMIPAGGLAEEARDAKRYRYLRSVGGRVWSITSGDTRTLPADMLPVIYDDGVDREMSAALSAPTPQQEQPR